MKLAERLGTLGDRLLVIVTSIVAFLMLTYSAYALYDSFYTGQNAFSSYDLQQYRPVQKESGEISFEELFAVTPDAVGWIYIDGTNIDYPVVQGRDNLEYANKDIYGKSSLTGAIYLASENDPGFVDAYNVIYGHHMDNGAMFGDIDKFRNQAFFDSHRVGVVQTPTGNWDLHVYACVQTDAYESLIYQIGSYNNEEIVAYVKEHAVNIAEDLDVASFSKLIMLSTCEDAETNGRLILVCGAAPRSEAFVRETEEDVSIVRRAIGHLTGSDHWALLNLLCVILTFYILLPLGYVRRKYRQPGFSRRVARKLEEYDDLISDENSESDDSSERESEREVDEGSESEAERKVDENSESETEREIDEGSASETERESDDRLFGDADTEISPEENQRLAALHSDNIWISGLAWEDRLGDRDKLIKDLRRFVKKILLGGILEVIAAFVAFQVFVRTENIYAPMVIRDEWTLLMIVIAAAALLVDFVCFRYRGTRLPDIERRSEVDSVDG